MSGEYAFLVGELAEMPGKDVLINALEAGGFATNVGQYSIRLVEFDSFVFRNLGGDRGEPMVSADNQTAQSLSDMARRVSSALAVAGIAHRFEIYDAEDKLFANFAFDWSAVQ